MPGKRASCRNSPARLGPAVVIVLVSTTACSDAMTVEERTVIIERLDAMAEAGDPAYEVELLTAMQLDDPFLPSSLVSHPLEHGLWSQRIESLVRRNARSSPYVEGEYLLAMAQTRPLEQESVEYLLDVAGRPGDNTHKLRAAEAFAEHAEVLAMEDLNQFLKGFTYASGFSIFDDLAAGFRERVEQLHRRRSIEAVGGSSAETERPEENRDWKRDLISDAVRRSR